MFLMPFLLAFVVSFSEGIPHHLREQSSSPAATFLKPKAAILRRLNPLKVLFTVAHVPERDQPYSVEWNLAVLKTMLLESPHVTDEDKALFMQEFGQHIKDYAHWSADKHNELERFTEKYLNLYKSPDTFLPFIDCRALTNALTDEMINDLHPNIDDEKRAEARARSVERLCDAE